VVSLQATRVVPQLLLFGTLVGLARICPAADGMSVVPTAHGPLMMLYLRQPLGARGAPRVYGLRVEQQGGTPPQAGAMVDPITSAMPGQRSIVDLQIRRASDVRVEFGQRVTWNVARHELGLSANQPNMALHLPTPVTPAPTVARSLP
jgi:hypothetical protein